MEKRTLKFSSFKQLSAFSRQITGGYLINTSLMTITAALPEFQVNLAIELFDAELIDTNERVYTYDPI